MGHQVIFADWVLALVADRVKEWPTRIVAGERVYELPIERGEPIYAFLDPAGVIVCLDLDSIAPAAERLRQHRAARPAPRQSTELERRLAGVPQDLPLRGAVIDRHGEIAQLLALARAGRRPRRVEAVLELIERGDGWSPASPAGWGSTVELAVDPATSSARRELLLADLQRYFAEHVDAAQATVRPSSRGVTLEVRIDELPRRFEEMQGGGRRRAIQGPEPAAAR